MTQRTPSLIGQLADQATITVEEAAQVLGLGRTAAYEAARRGEFPTRRATDRRARPGASRVAGGPAMRARDQWSPEELATFLDAARDGRGEAAWHLAAGAGLRIGELLALRWSHIDLDRGRVGVREAVVGVAHAALNPPATADGARTIDLDPATLAHLLRHRARQQTGRTEWGARYRDRALVIRRENGEPIHPRALNRAFSEIVWRAGLREIPLAALRRTGAALARPQGAPA